MSPITTHVLDLGRGRPAREIEVVLELESAARWQRLGQGRTDADGRLATLLAQDHRLVAGVYRLRFAVASYFERQGDTCFYPRVDLTFTVAAADQHYHVPLLLNAHGYSTYRGS